MKDCHIIHKATAFLTAAMLTAATVPAFSVFAAENHNTWTGYVLRNLDGNYLSVSYGTEGEGVSADFYEADGAAAYNTWYFTETNLGITIKSALSEGQYYLAEDGNGGLMISTTPSIFELSEAGVLSAFRSGPDNPVYAQVTPEAITNLHAGDMNQDGVLDGIDLTLMRQYINSGSDFVMTAIGDLNGDGNLTAADAAYLQQYLLGEAVTFSEIQIPDCTKFPIPAPVTTDTPPVQTTIPETTATTTTTTTTTTNTTATTTTSSKASTTLPTTTSKTSTTTTTTTTTATTTSTTITTTTTIVTTTVTTTFTTMQDLNLADMPLEYAEPMEWIWENRINDDSEGWVAYWDTIYDQIVAEDGHLYYVVKWQSNNTISRTQRQQIEDLLDNTINAWTDWLVGYDGWPYDHVDVEIVGWAVLDKSLLLDLQDDEIVYTDTTEYTDRDYIIECGMASDASAIPTIAPCAPSSLYRYDNYTNTSYVYGENRFDMYLQGVQGMTDMGGFGWGWGQELSDTAILGMAEGNYSLHILEHEIGHGFGLPDFYGEEGEADGYPPGGFPDDGTSIMMAGSSMKITDFDGWMLRYVWSKINEESGRFS